MAKRKFRRFARRAVSTIGRSYRRIRKSRSSKGGSTGLMNTVLPALLYGAVRDKAKTAATPITNMIPTGYGDELAFGLLGWYLSKKGSGFVHNAGKAILTVEAASVGHQLVGPMIGGAGATGDQSGWQ